MSTRAVTCLLLAPSLGMAQQGLSLVPRYDCLRTCAFDSARGRLVLFDSHGQTWERDGNEWLHRAPAAPFAPFGRTGAMLAFDAARGHVLMFGGTSTTIGRLQDTWVYDGTRWSQLVTSGPGIFTDAAMTFDSVRKRVVLLADTLTWEHDGTQWTQSTTTTSPAALHQLKMTFDTNRGVSVLSGEAATGSMALCEWNGQAWASRIQVVAPSRPSSMTFDAGRNRVVALVSGPNVVELWEWDGTNWTLRTQAQATTRENLTCWYDATAGRTQILAAERTAGAVDLYTSTWDGNAIAPASRERTLLQDLIGPAVFSTLDQTVLVGGGADLLVGTWIRSGNGWQPSPTTTTPPPRLGAAVGSSFSTGYLFGGSFGQTNYGDFWVWNGAQWSRLPSGPPPRHSAHLAVDPFLGRVLLYGGIDGGTSFGDCWLWNGVSWQQLVGQTPPPRHGGAMSWDPVRGVAVLFGGRTNTFAILDDTWEWNGSWQQRLVPRNPSQVSSPSLVFDWTRLRMQLVGVVAQPVQAGMWELSNSGWSLHAVLISQFGRPSEGMAAFDHETQSVVLTNGADVFEWSTTPADVTSYGTGCDVTPPRLALRQRARRGSEDGFELQGSSLRPCVFLIGDSAAALPLGNGCSQLVAGSTMTLFATTNALGFATTRLVVPDLGAIGSPIFAQAAILDPAALGGFTTTAALRITIGN